MAVPARQGLYDPRNEHDSCGVGFVANIKGRKSHDIIERGLQILVNLDHRGAVGADPLVGDGAGCLIQMPDALLREWAEGNGLTLPRPGHYAVAMCFLPRDQEARDFAVRHIEHFIQVEGQSLVGWRDVPTDTTGLGERVVETMPAIRQAIVAASPAVADQDAFERKILTIRKQALNSVVTLAAKHDLAGLPELYMPSFSTRTMVYKGLLLAPQVGGFYKDLRNPLTVSALALVHQRFSTNTFPSWRLAHPYRFLCHNGEINTVRGNVNWMHARRQAMTSELLGADLAKMVPLIGAGQSDTACIDNALELLVIGGGYSLSHAMMMLIPEAWAGDPLMDPQRRAFYEYHAALMEPWDGPAAIAFTDGRQIGATLDRNGLRPARYVITEDDQVIMASEAGVLPVPEERIRRKWRLQPGKMLLIDCEEGRIIDDDEIKRKLAAEHPYEAWLQATQFKLAELPELAADTPGRAHGGAARPNDPNAHLNRQQAFGYTQEDIQFFLEPMARDADDPVGSMGTDTPLAALSTKPKLLYDYFKQNFAQVTNPPIDPIREELVMSLVSMIGPRPNLLGHEAGTHHRLEVAQPILTDGDLQKIHMIETLVPAFRTDTLDATWPAAEGAGGMAPALERLCQEATEAVEAGHNILILSDRATSAECVPIPALLATSAVHHHLILQGSAHPDRDRRRDRRGARGPPFLRACRLWRRGGQPLSRLCHARPDPRRKRSAAQRRGGAEELLEGGRQGHPEGHVQDGHLDLSVLLRRADLRRGRARQRFCRQILHRHGDDDRRRRPARDRPRGGRAAPPRLWRQPDLPRHARCRRRLRLSPARRRPCLDAAIGRAAAARGARQLAGRLPRLCRDDQRPERAAADDPRADDVEARGRAGAARRGRAGERDRQALRHRCDELRLDQPRGAHDPGDRDEPHRRQVQHRRGRRGGEPVQAARQRRLDALGDQAGRLRPVRRHRPSTWSTPTICRSRWRRAPSPARAGSCRAARSTKTSPGCAIRPRASA